MREQPRSLPAGVVLEKPAKGVDNLAMTDAIVQLNATIISEWGIYDKFQNVIQYGIKPTNLALFYGPPGNGKTVAAKMIAGKLKVPLYRVGCEGLIHSHLGQSEKNMAVVMKFLETAGECVVLFDECETLFRKRKTEATDCGSAISSTMQVFWQALDRWETPQVFVLATNLIDSVDDALLSRVEVQLEFTGPTRQHTMDVLTYWIDILHEHGAEVWGPKLRKHYEKTLPRSFRELWQVIQGNVKAHIIAMAKD